jgi:hypothetical protein
MAHDCEGFSRIIKTAVSQANAVKLFPKSMNLHKIGSNMVAEFGEGVLDLESAPGAKGREWKRIKMSVRRIPTRTDMRINSWQVPRAHVTN